MLASRQLAQSSSRSILSSSRTVTIPKAVAATRCISSTGTTVGGTKTDHRKEFENPSRNQDGGQHSQTTKDTKGQGTIQSQGETKTGSPKAQDGKKQEDDQHVGAMGSG